VCSRVANIAKRVGIALGLAAFGVAAVVVVLLASGSGHPRESLPPASDGVVPGAAGSPERFTYLAAKRSNQCGMPAAAVLRMPSAARLQGACCGPMNSAEYRAQAIGLRAFRRMPEIPPDPYDMSVGLSKRLLRWERSIKLSRADAATYRRAMKMTHDHAPCCCPCWRWHAFRGLANDLIARRRWSAARVAHVIDLVEGCGNTRGGTMMRRPRA